MTEEMQYYGLIISMTSSCFSKCVLSATTPKLDAKERSCMRNCVRRNLRAQNILMKHLFPPPPDMSDEDD
jgi:hypothetical protein